MARHLISPFVSHIMWLEEILFDDDDDDDDDDLYDFMICCLPEASCMNPGSDVRACMGVPDSTSIIMHPCRRQ